MKYLLGKVTLVLIVFFSACTIEQDYTFEKDYSGNFKMSIDLTQMLAFMPDSLKQSDDIVSNVFKGHELDSLKEVVESTEGLSNFSMENEGNKIGMSFDFEELSSLKELTEEKETAKETGEMILFTPKGKKGLEIDLSPLLDLSDMLNQDSDGSSEDVQAGARMMMGFMRMKINLDFERKIKTVDTKTGSYNEGENRIVYDFTLAEIAEKKTDMLTIVKFK